MYYQEERSTEAISTLLIEATPKHTDLEFKERLDLIDIEEPEVVNTQKFNMELDLDQMEEL